MAERRMFTKKITESDAFLDMPASTQALYFHLNMSADDDGFVNNPKSVQRNVGASLDDMKLLLAKKFIIAFESGIIVIKHWKMHNYIQSDRYKPTDYVEEKSQLYIDEKKAYSLDVSTMDTKCIQSVSIGKDKIGEDKIDKDIYKEAFADDQELCDMFTDYVDMRKKIKAPMTNRAVQLAIDKLNKLSKGNRDTALEILRRSVMNSWKGLYELKADKPANKPAFNTMQATNYGNMDDLEAKLLGCT
ncbi:MAG: replisome organizer [Paludibacteraceae bacterium]|nr:replisome organizer [Paludibacteraceae bacterium]